MRGTGFRLRAIRLILLCTAVSALWLSANWWKSLASGVLKERERGWAVAVDVVEATQWTLPAGGSIANGAEAQAESGDRKRTADEAEASSYGEAARDDESLIVKKEGADKFSDEIERRRHDVADSGEEHVEEKTEEEEEQKEEAAEDEEDARANEDPVKQINDDAAVEEAYYDVEAEKDTEEDEDLQRMAEHDQEQEEEEEEQIEQDYIAGNKAAAVATVGLESELWASSPTSAPFASAWFADHVAASGVRCDVLMAGIDEFEAARAQRYLEATRPSLSCAAADAALAAASCESLRAAGYPLWPANSAEAEFPLAFGLRMHTCAAQAELLLRSVYAPQNVYCLHVDAEAGAEVIAAMRRVAACLPNVHLAPLDEDFVYASASQLRADLTCMRLLVAADGAGFGRSAGGSRAWRYFLNLAGQELPLRTNAELVALLRSYNGSNEVLSEYKPQYAWRYSEKVFCKRPVSARRRLAELRNSGSEALHHTAAAAAAAMATVERTGRCRPPVEVKSPPPRNVTVYKGLGYGFYSREFVEYALRAGGLGDELFTWFEDTWAPDEHFYATLARQPDAPGGYAQRAEGGRGRPKARAVRWHGGASTACGGKFVRKVCVFGVSDLPWLARRPEAVANKFYLDYDPLVVQCLAEWVHRRAIRHAAGRLLPP